MFTLIILFLLLVIIWLCFVNIRLENLLSDVRIQQEREKDLMNWFISRANTYRAQLGLEKTEEDKEEHVAEEVK